MVSLRSEPERKRGNSRVLRDGSDFSFFPSLSLFLPEKFPLSLFFLHSDSEKRKGKILPDGLWQWEEFLGQLIRRRGGNRHSEEWWLVEVAVDLGMRNRNWGWRMGIRDLRLKISKITLTPPVGQN